MSSLLADIYFKNQWKCFKTNENYLGILYIWYCFLIHNLPGQTDRPVMGMRTHGIAHCSSSSSYSAALLPRPPPPPPLPAAPWWFISPLWEPGLNPSKLLTLPAICSYTQTHRHTHRHTDTQTHTHTHTHTKKNTYFVNLTCFHVSYSEILTQKRHPLLQIFT